MKKFLLDLASLRTAIFWIVLVVGLVPAIILYSSIIQNYEENSVASRQAEVQNQLNILANHLVTYNYLANSDSDVINAELSLLSNLYDGRVLIIAENYEIKKDTYGISQDKIMVSEEIVRSFKGESIVYHNKENGYLEMTTPIITKVEKVENGTVTEENRVIGVLLASISTATITDTVEKARDQASILLMLFIISLIVLAMLCSHFLIVPFTRLRSQIGGIKAGYVDKIEMPQPYRETREITEAFNLLMSRMKVLDDSRQEFVANVSHELKTPLASMKVLADSIATMEGAPIELYQEFFQDITEEIDRENQIITDLLSLVKLDKKSADLNITQIDIFNLLEVVLKRIRPLARKKNIELVLESVREVVADGDEVKLNLAFMNLIENAVKYNEEHGSVTVSLDADHQFFTVTVIDTGHGIPEEDLEHIFERFYRVDKSHSREIGGTGLGLAITKGAIVMHNGTIEVSSILEQETRFTVKIPLKYKKQYFLEGK